MRQKKGKERFLTAEGVERLRPYHEYLLRWDRSKVLTLPGSRAIDIIYEVYTKETGDYSVRASKNCARCLGELFSAVAPVYFDTLEMLENAPQPKIVDEADKVVAPVKKTRQKSSKRANKAE